MKDWTGKPIAASLAAVVVYRAFNLVLLTFPALWARRRIKPLLDAAYEGRVPPPVLRRRAAATAVLIGGASAANLTGWLPPDHPPPS